MPAAAVLATQADAPVVASAVNATTATKYYYFNGQRIAMKKGDVLSYLHGDHLGSTVLETNTSGTMTADQQYYAYGRQRDTGPVVTDHKFTGQKQDATGLLYYGARYYDPEIGQFISPDTLVPDPGKLFDYNRYMYTRGNPMRYTDPSGHQSCMAMAPAMPLVLGCQAGELAMRYGPTIMQLAVQWADKLPAVDWLFSSAEQGAHSSGQQNAGNSASGDPNDPNQWGPIQEQRLRDMLSKTYNQRFGTTDAEIRKGLGISGKTADFLGYNAQQNRWLIAESKGGDLGKAYQQLTNTAQGLLSKVPEATGNLDLRIYMNATQYGKLTQGLLPGWRANNGYLGWLDESDQFVYAIINGAKVLVQEAQ